MAMAVHERTPRVELPSVGVDEMLNFDWQAFSGVGSHIPHDARAEAQISAVLDEPDLQTQRQLTDLTANIAELKDSIKELRKERRPPSSGEHLMLVSDALVALTKSRTPAMVDPRPVAGESLTDKKRARMERNRASAQESRERKRRYTEELEGKMKILREENAQHVAVAEELRKQIEALQGEVTDLRKAKAEAPP
eukprot:TRINITY_DN4591_c0_g1_i1.p1 TRINITY_DN4591_c0_g1~~TRINITY_DN4591_c0_g1_i1.p1  ORF type:complete len:195 (+),score=52.54 TRINITY_DN4591_c0_g1_i1:219-803(+)